MKIKQQTDSSLMVGEKAKKGGIDVKLLNGL
jgi:hypothetical protein